MADNYLITGYWGEPHVTAENDRGINAGIIGEGRYVLPVGRQFHAEYIGNNTVRIYDGKLVDNGAAAGIPAGEYIDLFVANASQGMKRNDLIVFQYEQDASTLVESGTFAVIQGYETSGNATDPALRQEDILSGSATFDQMALWRVPVSTGTISAPVQLFEVSKNLQAAGGGKNIVVDALSSDGASYTATVEDLEALYNGLEITIIPSITSTTTAPTLNVNGLGAKPIRLSLSLYNSMLVQPAKDDYYAAGRPIKLMFDAKYLSTGAWRVSNKQRPSAEDLYGTVPVTSGGTGVDSVTAGSLLVGNGEEPMQEMTLEELSSKIGGLQGVTLWENANASEFPAQTITVPNMNKWAMIRIWCNMGFFSLYNYEYGQPIHGTYINDGRHGIYTRIVTPNGNTVQFGNCVYSEFGSSETTQQNSVLVPIRIDGIIPV